MDIYKKIKELVEMMQEADLDEIEIKDGLREIRLTKRSPAIMSESGSVISSPIQASSSAPFAADGSASSAAKDGPPPRDENIIEFKSPMVGTFYRAPSPEAPPYATEGEKVTKDQTICIIEAMKVMNEIKAEEDCEVVDILVENGEAVEYGQPLCLIRIEK